MDRMRLWRVFRRLSGSRAAIAITMCALLLVTMLASAAWYAHSVSAQVGHKPMHAPVHGHVVKFPTRQAAGHLRASLKGPVLGSGDLQYGGGHVEKSPVSYVIFWGPSWTFGSGQTDAQVILNYFNNESGTSFEGILQQYSDTGGHISNTHTLAGTWTDSGTPTSDTSCNNSTTIEDQSLINEVATAMSVNGWPFDSTNATYYVYTPNGYYVNDGTGACSDLPGSSNSFCAYHSWAGPLGGPYFAYAAMPYPVDLSACGVSYSPNNDIAGDSEVNVTSHEQFESISDPYVCGTASECSASGFSGYGGWIDASDFEIGDKCAWIFPSTPNGTTTLNGGTTFEMQMEYSNDVHNCVNSANSHLQTLEGSVAAVTAPGTNAPSQTLTIKNSGTGDSAWSIGTMPTFVQSVTPNSGTLAPGASQPVTVTFNTSSYTTAQTLTGTLPINDTNADNAPLNVPTTVVLANVSKTWYFAEGYTGQGATEYLTIANPGTTTANVTVTYLLGSGGPIVKHYSIPGGQRFTKVVNDDVGANQNVSMVLTSDQPIVAERPYYVIYRGSFGSVPGASDVLGATSLATQFDFGYFDTSANHDTWLTILNNNSTPMTATVQYFPASGGAPMTTQHTIAANSRGTVYVNGEAGLAHGVYSALVSLSEPGLVERPLYMLHDTVTGYPGAADVVGVAQPQTSWYFAEGFTSATTNERYILANPTTATGTVSATVTFYRADGSSVAVPVSLAPGQQQQVSANTALGNNKVDNSAVVTASAPILAERLMSFTYFGFAGVNKVITVQGASEVLGASAPASLAYFAEGYTGGQVAEYLTIENPDPTATAHVQVSFLPQNGGPATVQTYTLGAHSRFTLYTNPVMVNQWFAMSIVSDVPVVAERPMYFNYNGAIPGGTDVVGYQP